MAIAYFFKIAMFNLLVAVVEKHFIVQEIENREIVRKMLRRVTIFFKLFPIA